MAYNQENSGVSELKLSQFELENSPLAIFSKRTADNLIIGGSEHSFGPFNTIENSSNIVFLVPAFTPRST